MKASVVKISDTSFKISLEHDGYEFKMGYDFAREWDANWLCNKLNKAINDVQLPTDEEIKQAEYLFYNTTFGDVDTSFWRHGFNFLRDYIKKPERQVTPVESKGSIPE